jgi:uncharacterized protein (DUF1015 family)
MPRVAPLRGIGYALDRFGSSVVPERVRMPGDAEVHPGRIADVTDLVCPPYDVIDRAQREVLLRRHERNAVRLELSPEPDPHAAAARELEAWLREGTLERRAEPSVYDYGHGRSAAPDEVAVRGLLTRVLLEPWGAGVRPHEHTMAAPKADRLALLQATRTQLSPILAVYFDPSEKDRHVLGHASSDEWRARDDEAILHQVAAIEPEERLLGFLARQTLFVADGHHRYETALAYQEVVRADPRHADAPPGELAADWIMMVLINAQREELEILPTHRLIHDADPLVLRSLASGVPPLFESLPIPAAALPSALEGRRDAAEPVFGLVLPGDEGYLLVGNPRAVADRMRRERVGDAVRGLDLAILHTVVFNDVLGIDAAAVAAGTRLSYTRSAADAINRVARGEAHAAILVRPTRMDQLAAVALGGDVMPQKSTYFSPKLLTGMVFNPLED